jgi:hypothetical protein
MFTTKDLFIKAPMIDLPWFIEKIGLTNLIEKWTSGSISQGFRILF